MTMIALILLLAAPQGCPGTNTVDVERYLAADLAHADAELNRYYAAAVKRLKDGRPATALAKLRASERAWVRHRDAECDAVWDYWEGGSIRGAAATLCRISLTRQRTSAIWRNWLTYADSTPPLLPRPAAPE